MEGTAAGEAAGASEPRLTTPDASGILEPEPAPPEGVVPIPGVDISQEEPGTRLVLPSDNPEEWARVVEILSAPIDRPADLDAVQTKFAATDSEPRVGRFFSTIPGTAEAGKFDFDAFFAKGLPLLIAVALEMPTLFDGVQVPIFKTRSTWEGPAEFVKRSVSLTRRQCACLLAHSFFGSLKRPPDVQPNDFRFTVVDLFIGTAVSPNSATTFLNYFVVLGRDGILDDEVVTFERQGYCKGPSPWIWDENAKPLCKVELTRGSIDDCPAEVHVEFANSFPGGGVMTGDAAQEETLFLVKPELMVAMALMNRMVDEEIVAISGAVKYSLTRGFGQDFEFDGDYDGRREGPPPKVVAIDAIRGGGPAMTKPALLRDMNKARIAFDGAREVGTGHWGCGAFGNNHDLMFLKQWLAASESGVTKLWYYDFSRKQSHSIFPLIKKLQHLSVGKLWAFMLELTQDLPSHDVASFSKRIANIALGKLAVPGGPKHSPAKSWTKPATQAAEMSQGIAIDGVARNAAHADGASKGAADAAPGTDGSATGVDPAAVVYKGVAIDTMSFVALRAACVEAGLSGEGAKPRLLYRLRTWLESQ